MCSAADVGADAVPHGFTVRRSPHDATALWYEVVPLPDGRIGLVVGHIDDPDVRDRLRSDLRSGCWDGLDGAGGATDEWMSLRPFVSGVIDQLASQLSYRVFGDHTGVPAPLMAAPDVPARPVPPRPDQPVSTDLPPGSTVLFCTSPIDSASTLLDEFRSAHPDCLADQLIGNLSPQPHPGVVAVLYRHPPQPLSLTMPAVPANLVDMRDHLRSWLALAGVAAEPAADVLLAVGEAASNAAEHAGPGVPHDVTLTVHARVSGEGLRFTVSDNGRWRTPPADPGHRGHGLRLINALVDVADLTTTDHGTTVEMLKELR